MTQKMTDDEWREFASCGIRTGKPSIVRAVGGPCLAPIRFLLQGNGIMFDTGRDTEESP